MRIRLVCFILLVFSSCFGFAQLQVTVFTGVSLGCSRTVIAPNSTIDIGSLQVGTSANGALCLINTGTSMITVTGVTVTGADFSLGAGTLLPLVLQPGAGSPIVAGFNFAPTSAGTKTAQMSLVDDASGSPQSFTLSGTGFTDFGLNTLVAGDNTHTVTAGQGTDYQLTLSGADIPPGPTAFNGLVSFSCGNLPQGASCTFSPASGPLGPTGEFLDINLNVSTTARPAASLHSPRLQALVLPWRRCLLSPSAHPAGASKGSGSFCASWSSPLSSLAAVEAPRSLPCPPQPAHFHFQSTPVPME